MTYGRKNVFLSPGLHPLHPSHHTTYAYWNDAFCLIHFILYPVILYHTIPSPGIPLSLSFSPSIFLSLLDTNGHNKYLIMRYSPNNEPELEPAFTKVLGDLRQHTWGPAWPSALSHGK